ncbi:MAG: DNA gyrase C-terminal beta-propeller domain-containing protein, partial [Nitrospinales bacterium]
LKEILHQFIIFRKEIVTKRTEYDLRKAKEKEHVLEGLKIAIDNLDAVVQLIREAENPQTARERLMTQFALTEIQAKAILDLRLHRLTGLERDKIIQDLIEIQKQIKEYENILGNESVKMKIISEELAQIKEKYGDERRTEILETEDAEINIEDMIPDEEMVVTYSRDGYIKRQSVDLYRSQRRGGKGIKGMQLREEDMVEKLFIASTHTNLLVFTNSGKVHWLKVYNIPEVSRTAKGKPIVNLLHLQAGEDIAGILSVKKFEEGKFVIAVTQKGLVKKTALLEYSRPRIGGIIGLTINEGDRLIAAELCDDTKDIFLATKNGMSIRFEEKEVRAIGRSGRGVRGISLRKGDEVVGVEIVESGHFILTATDKGYGKRTPVEEYRRQSRGGVGVITIKTGEKIGSVVGIQQVTDNDDILMVTSSGTIVRMNVGEISVIGRNTQGVRLVRLNEESRVVSLEKFVESIDEQ